MSERTELQEILALTREFALAELRPKSEAWDHAGALGEGTVEQLAELGFLGMLAPESAGGMGLDRASTLAAVTQLAWGEASAGLAVALHNQVVGMVARSASDAARECWLGPLAAGQLVGCAPAAPAEPSVVSATADNDGWVLHGEVPWVGSIGPRSVLAVLAETAGSALLCLVPAEAAGVGRAPVAGTLGFRPLAFATVTLSDVRVPAVAVLGGPGLAAGELAAQADDASLAVAAVAVGIAQAALDHARDYADVREQFGHKLRDFEGMQRKLADMAIRVAGARALLERAATEPEAAQVSAAKVTAAEAAMYVTTQAVQVFGGYGYMRDYPVEKLMRDARAMSLWGGLDEQHRARIVERLYTG